MTAMTRQHPLLKIALNSDGHLSWPILPGETHRCPTCLRHVTTGPDGDLVHSMEEGGNVCIPSASVVISKAIIEMLSAGERLYVNPIKNGNKTLAPSFIFLHTDQ
ncbi:hypothetical protein GMG72_24350, partial [Salmonella enterica subsp. enterica]|nr:hypothetical protein [Salmonella enterica subsp. enterica]